MKFEAKTEFPVRKPRISANGICIQYYITCGPTICLMPLCKVIIILNLAV